MAQKVISYHHIYFASTWLFLNYQVNMLEKIFQDFLWLYGMENSKRCCIGWSSCYRPKNYGGLGLNFFKAHGVSVGNIQDYARLLRGEG